MAVLRCENETNTCPHWEILDVTFTAATNHV